MSKEITLMAVMANLEKRFNQEFKRPGNPKVPVKLQTSQAYLTREEWEVLVDEVQNLIFFQEVTLNKEYTEEETFDDLSSFDVFYDDLGKIMR